MRLAQSTGKMLTAERSTSTKPNPKPKAPVGASAAVDVATVPVAEEDATSLTFTAPFWKQMDWGREQIILCFTDRQPPSSVFSSNGLQ